MHLLCYLCIRLMSKIKSRESFESIKQWCTDASNYCREKTVYGLVGTKSDLDDHRVVSYEEGMEKMKELELDFFFETSAKTSANVKEMFFETA